MIVVMGILETNAASIAAVKDALVTMQAASRAEAGCEDYTFSVDIGNPDVLRISERWESAEALAAHFKSTHMATFQKALSAHPPTGSDVRFYEASPTTPPR